MGIELTISIIWILVAVIFAIVEAMTLSIITIWFSVGALAAAFVAQFVNNIGIQTGVFLATSILLLYFTRPIAEKYLKIGKKKTNMESLIGEKAIITEPVYPNHTGQAKVRGQAWTCEGINREEHFENGEEVIIERIEGVRLLIKRKAV